MQARHQVDAVGAAVSEDRAQAGAAANAAQDIGRLRGVLNTPDVPAAVTARLSTDAGEIVQVLDTARPSGRPRS